MARVIAAVAACGGAAVIVGAFLPWISVFHGLRTYDGIIGRNGRLLIAGGAFNVAVAACYAIWPRRIFRYVIAATGLALALFSAYLLAQLLAAYRSLQSMFVPDLGPGIFVAASGALVIMATVLIGPQTRPREQATKKVGAGVAAMVTLSAGAGAIHLAVAPDHFHEYTLYGAFFVALGLAQLAWAALTALGAEPRWLLIGAAAVNATVVALWAITRTTGLPIGPTPRAPEAIGFPDLAATTFELVLIAVIVARLRHPSRTTQSWRTRLNWLLPIGVTPAMITAIWMAVGGSPH